MFPNEKEKYCSPSVVDPKRYVEYLRKVCKQDRMCPDKVIICYQSKLYNQIKKNCTVIRKGQPLIIDVDGMEIGVVGGFGVGAPIAVVMMEEMIALGAKEFISIGSSGTLQKDLSIGDTVLVDRAIRDEGTSHHYLESQKYVEASNSLTARLEKTLSGSDFRKGTTWTTDAPYRETEYEVKKYQQEGILTVEMEAAALFSVAKFRKVEVASLIMISDSLADLVWDPMFATIDDKMIDLFNYACQALIGEK